MRKATLYAMALGATLFVSNLSATLNYGTFQGRVATVWLGRDHRKMRLLEEFSYKDPNNVVWNAPAGSVIDGASIPFWAWSLIGGPFEGPYREASVIHDVACENKKRTWEATHEAFFTAMLSDRTPSITAKIMYAAVYHFGPRWATVVTKYNVALKDVDRLKAQFLKQFSVANSVTVDLSDNYDYPDAGGLGGSRYGAAPPRPPGPPTSTTLTFHLIPKPNALTRADFDILKERIKRRNLSLEEIRLFDKPVAR